MVTSIKSAVHFLGTRQIERFLVDFANAQSSHRDGADLERIKQTMKRLTSKHPEFFTPPVRGKDTAEYLLHHAVQRPLRMAWETGDPRERDWLIFLARQGYYRVSVLMPLENALNSAQQEKLAQGLSMNEIITAVEPDSKRLGYAREKAPPWTPLEQVLYYFQRHAERARRCSNPECPAPYFFATKKGQKYCSSKCSAPAQRDQKRRWWRENRAKGVDR